MKSAEYECVDTKQPQNHNYISRDTVGQFKIRTEKYVMNANENKRKDAWSGENLQCLEHTIGTRQSLDVSGASGKISLTNGTKKYAKIMNKSQLIQ